MIVALPMILAFSECLPGWSAEPTAPVSNTNGWTAPRKLAIGLGYNFTDFSDDMTDMSYDSQGVFLNVITRF